ncbi:MAG: hypothetical protein WCL37_00655, partial [Chrysiogenales bacterium]
LSIIGGDREEQLNEKEDEALVSVHNQQYDTPGEKAVTVLKWRLPKFTLVQNWPGVKHFG